MEPRKFRKKPVVVEAMLYSPGACRDICVWVGIGHNDAECGKDVSLKIPTREGYMEAMPGDWILRGWEKEEFYVCKPDIFDAIYEDLGHQFIGAEYVICKSCGTGADTHHNPKTGCTEFWSEAMSTRLKISRGEI